MMKAARGVILVLIGLAFWLWIALFGGKTPDGKENVPTTFITTR